MTHWVVSPVLPLANSPRYLFEVEFTDSDGRAFASLVLNGSKLMTLHYQPAEGLGPGKDSAKVLVS